MNHFHEMLRRVLSSPHHEPILRFTSPLKDHFGINHFWYYKVTFSGYYTYFGTHTEWSEFCFEKAMLSHFPCLRHPDTLQKGINLMKASPDLEYRKVLETAWDRFRINFNINLINGTKDGIEAFGFATQFNDPFAEQRLLNNLSLLNLFIGLFKAKFRKFFHFLDENQINLSDQFGSLFYEHPGGIIIPDEREKFLRKMGMGLSLTLTPREIDVLKLIAYPSTYVAGQLGLSKRTVENYIATIKSKLACSSKVELIHRSQEIISSGYFD